MIPDTNIKKIREIHSPSEALFIKYINSKKSIASAHMDGSITIYSAKNFKQEIVLVDTETSSINNACTCFDVDPKSMNNLITATYSGGLIKIWDYIHGNCLVTVREKRQINGVVHHPKKQKFFTYGDDGKVHLYDTETKHKEYVYFKSERNCLDGHVSKVFTLRFNPGNMNEFLTGGWDNTIYIWDVRCQNAIRHLSDIFICGDGIVFNKSGHQIFTAEWKKEDPLKHWDLRNGKIIEVIKPDPSTSHLYCVFLLCDEYLATGGSEDNLFRVISLETKSTASFVKDLGNGVYSIDTCNYPRGNVLNKYEEFGEMPIILFSSGSSIYEVRYRLK